MHQRQPISIDKRRPFSGQYSSGSSPSQVSFHKIYRKKRCHSLVDKERSGHGGGSQWNAGLVNSQRDSDGGPRSTCSSGLSSDGRSRHTHSPGFSNRKSTQGIGYRQGNHSSTFAGSPPNRDVASAYCRHYWKRPNYKLRCNSVAGPEFDEPLIKKQKVEFHRSLTVQHGFSAEAGQDRQKTVVGDTKWMYKNQHAKMSGPYGVKQLIEGFYSGFLREDLPVHQFIEGKLCKPIMLKELVADLESCSSPMQILKRAEGSFCQFTPSVSPNKTIKVDVLPPGFGAYRMTHPKRPNSYIWPKAPLSTAGERSPAGAFSPPGSEDFGLPPGFEAIAGRAPSIQPQSTELSASTRRLLTAAGMGLGDEGGQRMQSCHEKLEPVVHNQGYSNYQGSLPHARPGLDKSQQLEGHSRGHVSHHHSSPPSTVSFTLQGAMNLKDESLSSETTWGFTSPNTRPSNPEPQSTTVCVGVPVSKPAMPAWNVASCLPVSCAKATQADKELLSNELHKCSAKHGIDLDPLLLIHLELLAAVQRSYMKTVWSALIDEELKYWIGGKSTMAKSVVTDDSSWSREASSSLSSVEFGVSTLESLALRTDVSVILAKDTEILLKERAAGCSDGSCVNAHVESAETFLEIRAAQFDDGGGISPQSVSIYEAVSPRKDANAYTSHAIETIVRLCVRENTELHQSSKAESGLSIDERSKLPIDESSKLATSVNSFKGVCVDHTGEVPQQSRGVILHGDCAALDRNQTSGKTSDANFLETEPAVLVYRRKKHNIKSLRQLMKCTSIPSPRQSTAGTSEDKVETGLGGAASPEGLETNPQVGLLSVEGYNGCARMSVDGWLWRTVVRHDPHLKGLQAKLQLARSRIHGWGVFAAEPVDAGDFVIEYVGEVIRPRVADIRERRYRGSGIGSSFLLRVDDEAVVDATKRGGLARFMNYSCDPNCSIKFISTEGSKKAHIYARRLIAVGEELTHDRKFKLEDGKIPCNCGSSRCWAPFLLNPVQSS